MKKIILSVTNDLTSEQRVHKVCLLLVRLGFDVTLVGREKSNSLPLSPRGYKIKRLRLVFEKGSLFYAEYNVRLFIFLLVNKADILVANDLDTLLSNFLVTKFKNTTLVHDSHEYFTEVPELTGRPGVKKIWKFIEQTIFPTLKYVYTVSDSIANLYKKEYGIEVKVVRNFPILPEVKKEITKSKQELGLPENKKIILYQGSVNVDRGLLEAVEAMQYLEDTILLIVGDGDILDQLKQHAVTMKVNDKVIFKKRVYFEELYHYTLHADVGISLDKNTNINYKYSLPNKIFDYLQAGVPVLVSNMIEIQKIFFHYAIGEMIENHEPNHIADKLNIVLHDAEKRNLWKTAIPLAAKKFCWQNEEQELKNIFSDLA